MNPPLVISSSLFIIGKQHDMNKKTYTYIINKNTYPLDYNIVNF